MAGHLFIFGAADWVGEGTISFSASPDLLKFRTLWTFNPEPNSIINCVQRVEITGNPEPMMNHLKVVHKLPSGFTVELSNELVGKVAGKGIIDERSIAWEFKDQPGFEGFEVYELQSADEYAMHAEYFSEGQFRTIVDGKIWLKKARP